MHMTYFVRYTDDRYGPSQVKEFNNETDLLDFIHDNAPNNEFFWKVFEGKEVELEPVKIVTKYKIKR